MSENTTLEHLTLAELTEQRRRSDRIATAAPDLLAALKGLVTAIESVVFEADLCAHGEQCASCDGRDAALTQARAAIARADGGAE